MKKTPVLLALLCIAVLTACSNPFRGGRGNNEGTITIAFGNDSRAARLAVTADEITSYSIILTGPGGERITESVGRSGTVSISVRPGAWNITVRGMGPRPEEYAPDNDNDAVFQQRTMLRALGFGEAEVRAGENSSALIQMTSATEVENSRQLSLAINSAGSGMEKIIVVMNDIKAEAGNTIAEGQNIILVPGSNEVTIE